MNLKKLESYVDYIILQRGKSYYIDNLVEDLEETEPDFWQAWIEGTELYDIEINLNGNEVLNWYCNCPYDHGPMCKHTVATLLAIRDQKQIARTTTSPRKAICEYSTG